MNNLKISVITVCYNALTNIEETINSVLNQSYPNIEYIIIDGGSTDGTIDIIKKYSSQITYWVSEPDKGIYDAMNKGISVATGDYINFMNAGDSFFDKSTLTKIFSEKINNNPTVIYGDTLEVYKTREIIRHALNPQELKKRGIMCHQSALIRRDYHINHLYDLNYKILADFNFFFRAYNYDKQIFLRQNIVVSRFSMQDNGLSKRNYDRNYNEYLRIISQNITMIDRLKLNIRKFLGKIKRSILNIIH